MRPRRLGLSLAYQHGSDAEPHEEQTAEAIEQVGLAFELVAIAVDDCNRHDGDKTVESVKCRKLKLVFVDHNDAKSDLNKDGEFCDTGVPPQSTSA